jgi:hypothetical protein
LFNFSGQDVVIPAVYVKGAMGNCMCDGGLGAEVGELGDNVAADD